MSLLDTRYIYCGSHGTVHAFKEGGDVWCTAAQKEGMDLRYVHTMQQFAGWDDEQSMQFARKYCKDLGLWLYEP